MVGKISCWLKNSAARLGERRSILFLLLFVAASLLAYRINFSQVMGAEKEYFTLFQFFGPVSGAFLGPVLGAGIVLATELINVAVLGSELTLFGVLRFSTLMAAAFYFGSRKPKLPVLVPLACVVLFVLHPVGGAAALYSLYWFIPAIALLFPRNLILKSFGATFTAHAVGSVLFLYSFPSTPAFWLGLIPQVLLERTMFALGIAVSFIALHALLSRASHILPWRLVQLDRDYALFNFSRAVKA